MLTVHLRINDSTMGKPTPVRLRISGPDGTTYAPLGRSAEFPTGRNEAVGGHLKLGGERWCYIDGLCEVSLLAGIPLRVQATKGPEYMPLDEMVTLGTGQMALRFSITRVFNSRGADYHPGDTRCHFIAPHAGLLEAMAEDLDVVNALATPFSMLALDGNTYTTVPDLLAFSGQQPALTAEPNHSFAVNTLNAHPVLGKVGLLHSHRAVFPLAFGGPEGTDDWSICDWCDQCHRKGGLTVWVDAFEPAGELIGGEALIAAILGKIDAIEIDPGPRTRPLLPWLYRLWNVGMMVPLVGGSGKDSNRTPLGAVRTYAHVPGEFSPQAWIEAIRGGRTFVASAPLVEFQVDGHHPGEIVDASGEVMIAAKAESLGPFERLEIIANGEVIASAPPRFIQDPGNWSAELQHGCTQARSCWVAARCIGKAGFAHTSPIVVRVHNQPSPPQTEAATALRKLVEQTREWGECHACYNNAKRREQLLGRCDEALGKLGVNI
jgi:hypothetical protein